VDFWIFLPPFDFSGAMLVIHYMTLKRLVWCWFPGEPCLECPTIFPLPGPSFIECHRDEADANPGLPSEEIRQRPLRVPHQDGHCAADLWNVRLPSSFSSSLFICDAAHEKVPNRRNGVINMVVQRTYQGIKENKNHSKIPSTF